MKTKTLLLTAAIAMCVSVAAQDTEKHWELQLNTGISSSVLLYQESEESSYRLGAIDPYIGVSWRRMIASRMAVRAGLGLRTTTVRYGLEAPLSSSPVPGIGMVMRQSVGVNLPLIFDVDIVKPEEGIGFRWLIGAVLQCDIESIEHFRSVSNEFDLADVNQPIVYFGVLTGFEIDFPLAGEHRLLLAPQVAIGMPDRSPFALSDMTPSSSLLTGGLRLSYVPGARSKLSQTDDTPKKNRLLLGTGGRSHARSLHMIYERALFSQGYWSLYGSASGGYGFFGASGSAGVIGSFGGKTHAVDVGLAAGFLIEAEAFAPIGEIGYRLSLLNGFVGRLSLVHWPVLGENYINRMLSLSVGKAF